MTRSAVAAGSTVVRTVATLFEKNTSGTDDVTLAVFVSIPALSGLTNTETLAEAPPASVPRAQWMSPALFVQVPCDAEAPTKLTPAGRGSRTATLFASNEPPLVTVIE